MSAHAKRRNRRVESGKTLWGVILSVQTCLLVTALARDCMHPKAFLALSKPVALLALPLHRPLPYWCRF